MKKVNLSAKRDQSYDMQKVKSLELPFFGSSRSEVRGADEKTFVRHITKKKQKKKQNKHKHKNRYTYIRQVIALRRKE